MKKKIPLSNGATEDDSEIEICDPEPFVVGEEEQEKWVVTEKKLPNKLAWGQGVV